MLEVLGEEDYTDWIAKVRSGLRLYEPEICEEGLNGTYFLKDSEGDMIGVFKPQDEEGNSPGNPKKSTPSEFVERGVLDGEGAQREVAAYLLDRADGFAGVPVTTMVRLTHPVFGQTEDGQARSKTGSLQQFVRNDGASWDIGFGAFPTHEVHKIGIFDLRIFNNDRHGGNMLMTLGDDGTYVLTPIDHGFSLSSSLSRAWFDWLTWPQAKRPFSKEELEYIAAIDSDKDVKTLESLQIRPECLRTMKISTMILKRGAAAGLTLYDLGSVVSRAVLEEPSELELMYHEAVKELGLVDGEIHSAEDEDKLLQTIARIWDQKLEQRVNPPVQTVAVN
jgi:hypothetical protein